MVFVWDRAGVSNLFLSDGSGGAPTALTTDGAAARRSGAPTASASTSRMAATCGRCRLTGGAPAAVWTTPRPESEIALSPDGSRVAFVRGAYRPRWQRAACVRRWPAVATWSRPTTRQHRRRQLVARRLAAGFSRRRALDPSRADAGVLGRQDHLHDHRARARRRRSSCRAAAARRCAIGRRAAAATCAGSTRTASSSIAVAGLQAPHDLVADASTAASRASLHEDVDDKFWSMTGDAGGGAQPSPDGKWIAFLSDRDGWDHLYVMPAARRRRRCRSRKGKFEAWRPSWSPDSTRIAFDANEPEQSGDAAPRRRDDRRRSVAARRSTMITSGRGTNIAPQWSPDGTRLVYQHTDPQNSADLFVIDARSRARRRCG